MSNTPIFKLADVLCMLWETWYENPEVPALLDMIDWLSQTIERYAGISYNDIMSAGSRMARGEGLAGYAPGSAYTGPYAGPGRDLLHVPIALGELDDNGTTNRLLRQLCLRYPLFRTAFRQAFFPEEGKPVGSTAASGVTPNPSTPTTSPAAAASSPADSLPRLPGEDEEDWEALDRLPWEDEKDWEALEPMVRRLIRHMQGRDRAELADLCPLVWEKDFADVTDPALHSAVSKANKFLAKRQLPLLEKVRREPVLRRV